MPRPRWTKEQEDELLGRVAAGEGRMSIARAMDRTFAAVGHRLYVLRKRQRAG